MMVTFKKKVEDLFINVGQFDLDILPRKDEIVEMESGKNCYRVTSVFHEIHKNMITIYVD